MIPGAEQIPSNQNHLPDRHRETADDEESIADVRCDMPHEPAFIARS